MNLLNFSSTYPIWALLHKLRAVMGKRDSQYTLEGIIELDEGQWCVTKT